jgi:hypothetical protein
MPRKLRKVEDARLAEVEEIEGATRLRLFLWSGGALSDARREELTLALLAVTEPEAFLDLRRAVLTGQVPTTLEEGGRPVPEILEDLHGRLWEKPGRGRPSRGPAPSRKVVGFRARRRRQLEAVTLYMTNELAGEPYHGLVDEDHPNNDVPDLDRLDAESRAAIRKAFPSRELDVEAALSAAVVLRPEERRDRHDARPLIAWERHDPPGARPVFLRKLVPKILTLLRTVRNEMVAERRVESPRGKRLHTPQEWAAMALLRLWHWPPPVSWRDARALLAELTRGPSGKTPKRSK